jgi:hypothetical protein
MAVTSFSLGESRAPARRGDSAARRRDVCHVPKPSPRQGSTLPGGGWDSVYETTAGVETEVSSCCVVDASGRGPILNRMSRMQ